MAFVLQSSRGARPAGLVARRKRGAAAAAAAARAFERRVGRRQKVFRRRARLWLRTGPAGGGAAFAWSRGRVRSWAGGPASGSRARCRRQRAGSHSWFRRPGPERAAGSRGGSRAPRNSPGPPSLQQTPPAGRTPRPWSPSPTNCSSSCPS